MQVSGYVSGDKGEKDGKPLVLCKSGEFCFGLLVISAVKCGSVCWFCDVLVTSQSLVAPSKWGKYIFQASAASFVFELWFTLHSLKICAHYIVSSVLHWVGIFSFSMDKELFLIEQRP